MKKIKKLLNNQSGSALIFVIITLTVTIILGTALMSLNVADITESSRQSDSLQAYYLAKSGAVSMGTKIIENSESMSTSEFEDFLSSIVNQTSDKTEIAEADGYFQVDCIG
jgi:Tfp pilus assembly protein PilX